MAARPRRPRRPRPHRSRCGTRAATSCARPATPPSSSATSTAAFDRLRRAPRAPTSTAPTRRPRSCARKNFAATGAFLAEDRPRALDLLGFSSQLVFNTFHNRRLRDWEHGGDLDLAYGAARAHNRGHGRVLLGRPAPAAHVLRAARRLRPRRGHGRRGASPMGAAALLVASGCPPGHSPSHVGLDPVWARAQEAGIPVVFHVGGTGDLIDRELLPQRPADPARLPRRRGELPVGRLHGHPRPAGADAGHDDLRRRARAVPRAAHRRDRAGRHLGAVVDAADGVGVRRVRTATRSGCGRCRCARASTCAARCGSRRTPPRTSAGSSSRPGPRCACSRRTTRTSRAAAGPIERFEAIAAATPSDDGPPALLLRQLPRPDGHRRRRLGRVARSRSPRIRPL